MAKGQSLKSDNLLVSDQTSMGQHRRGAADDGLAELDEDEMWSMTSWRAYHDDQKDESNESKEEWRCLGPTAIGIGHRHKAPETRKNTVAVAASAPINVPSWSRIGRVDLVGSVLGGVDSGEEWDRVPPHEYLAREYGHSRKGTATSVLEGVGRTLKDRDMSRVREMVWNQTGFSG